MTPHYQNNGWYRLSPQLYGDALTCCWPLNCIKCIYAYTLNYRLYIYVVADQVCVSAWWRESGVVPCCPMLSPLGPRYCHKLALNSISGRPVVRGDREARPGLPGCCPCHGDNWQLTSTGTGWHPNLVRHTSQCHTRLHDDPDSWFLHPRVCVSDALLPFLRSNDWC